MKNGERWIARFICVRKGSDRTYEKYIPFALRKWNGINNNQLNKNEKELEGMKK